MNTIRLRRFVFLAAVALAVAACGGEGGNAGEDGEAGALEGERLTLIIPNNPGGAMDTYGRLIVDYVAEHSGASDIVVENDVGAGGVVGMNSLWEAEPDGLTFGFGSAATVMFSDVAESEGVQFDATEFTYLGRAASNPRLLIVGSTSEIGDVDDLLGLDEPFIFPSQGTDEDFYTLAILMDALGVDMEVVTGYDGSAATELAMISGEGDGLITVTETATPYIDAGDARPVFMISSETVEGWEDVPVVGDLVGEDEQAVVQTVVDIVELHRSFIGPPGMSDDITAELRSAISDALADPDLIAAAEEAGLHLAPVDGVDQAAVVDSIAENAGDLTPLILDAVEDLQ